jgi:hypothetical protein
VDWKCHRPTSSANSTSFLSSHHSDDYLLASESYAGSPPPWVTPSISESVESSIFSESTSFDPGLYRETVLSSLPPLPPSSPTSSPSTSTVTVRPLPTPDFLGPLNAIRDQLDALLNEQASTIHILDTLRDQLPQDNTELINRLRRIEHLLRSLLPKFRGKCGRHRHPLLTQMTVGLICRIFCSIFLPECQHQFLHVRRGLHRSNS